MSEAKMMFRWAMSPESHSWCSYLTWMMREVLLAS
jgi:hypothetical protein